MSNGEPVFADLPAALVEKLIENTKDLSSVLKNSLDNLQDQKEFYRKRLLAEEFIYKDAKFNTIPVPTTCGVDGSYVIDRLLAVDLMTCAAIAVEGLIPPSEKRFWKEPHFMYFVHPEPHNDETTVVLQALMFGFELSLAVNAPHNVIFLDGSLTTPLIRFNQAVTRYKKLHHFQCAQTFISNASSFFQAYQTILQSVRTDRQFVGVPKYTTRKELGIMFDWPDDKDDRAMMTFILEPGEWTKPIPLAQPSEPWHLSKPDSIDDSTINAIISGINEIHVVYYKPMDYLPAFRLETPISIAKNNHRLGSVIQAVKHQTALTSIFEPYPLYFADRMVKSLARTVPYFRQTMIQRLAEVSPDSVGDIYLALHAYRSESGRH